MKLTNQRLSRERERERERMKQKGMTENENGEMNEWGWLLIVMY